MSAARLALAIAGCAAPLLAAPSGIASAAAGGPALAWTFTAALSNGYRLRIVPVIGFAGPTVLDVTVVRGVTTQTEITYYPKHPTWGYDWMRVNIGGRLAVDVRFHSSGGILPLRPVAGCAGSSGKQLLGTWRGRIRFAGERGYAEINTAAVPGAVTLKQPRLADGKCPFYRDWPYPHHWSVAMNLRMQLGERADLLTATLARGVPTVQFIGQSAAPRDGSSHGLCTVSTVAPARDLRVSSDLNWATMTPPRRTTLRPPWPFRGSATFIEAGNLSGSAQPITLDDNRGPVHSTIQAYCPNIGWVPATSAPVTSTASWGPDTNPPFFAR